MHSDDTLWYKLGYALERARAAPPRAIATVRGVLPTGDGGDGSRDDDDGPVVDALLLGGAGALASRLLKAWPARTRPGILDLAAAGASGAAAGFLVELLEPLLRGELRAPTPDAELVSSMLSGVGRGLAYGVVVEPRTPGPAYLAGLLYGTLEYMVAPWGGLPGILGSASPHRKLPLISDALEPGEDEDAVFLDFAVFGLALGLLYGAARDRSGTTPDE